MGDLPPKLFFRIGEVAGLVGVEPHVLRYWEREFRSIRPTKSAKGQRVYSRKDVENLLRVRDLLYGDGFTIAGAKKKLTSGAADAAPVSSVERASGFGAEPQRDARDVETERASGFGAEPQRDARDVETERASGFGAEPQREEVAESESEVEAESAPEMEPAMSAAPSSDTRSTRDKLVALRDEVESFLAELSRR